MSSDPLVSVVMAVYDGEDHLQEAIDSILAQSFRDFEFIIVDDGSTDRTPELLRAYAQSDVRIRLQTQERAGLIASLNRGCALARGRYIARMDADDVAFPARLERQIAFLEARPEVALLGVAYVVIDEQGVPALTLYKPPEQSQITRTLGQYANPFLHPSILMRRDVFHAVGGYRSAFLHAEDYDLWLRISERHETANLSEPLLEYRVHHGQLSHRNLQQGIVSVIGAQISARARRESGREPEWRGAHVGLDDLRDAGVSEALVEATLSEACFWQANLMLLSGYADTAVALFAEALDHAGASAARKRLGRAVFAGYVAIQRRRGGLLRRVGLELLLVSSAACVRFALLDPLLRGKLERLVQLTKAGQLPSALLRRTAR